MTHIIRASYRASRRAMKGLVPAFVAAAMLPAHGADSWSATHCLRIVEKDGRNAIFNGCSAPVRYAFCGTDAGVHEIVGVCGRDIGGSLVAPGQSIGLTQGAQLVRYFFLGCFEPYAPMYVRFTGVGIEGQCRHL